MTILEVKNLHVEREGKEILKGVNMTLELGKVNALMGPNGSGKSTLAHVLMGNPLYTVKSGQILFNGEDITTLSPDERAKKGLFLSFQNPIEVSGVQIPIFLRTAHNKLNSKKSSIFEFKELLEKKAEQLKINKNLLNRNVNEGFSGGEKKKTEILQLSVLDPQLAILDETDSGLDIDSLKDVSNSINNFMNTDKCILIITHYKRILDHIPVDKVFIMSDGKIEMEGGNEIVNRLEEEGYNILEKND